ncbi:MAG: phospholipase D-like domain-containing protein, partial [Gammaproteobacteria bacterium]
ASPSSLHAKVVVIDRSRSIVGSLNQDPRSRLYNTESWVSIESAALAERLAGLFEEGTEAHHSFRLRLGEGGVEWITDEGGREVRYGDEPLASSWQRFLKALTSVFVPEALL